MSVAKLGPVNVRRIAQEAGVSHITVSRALRDGPNVAEATRARVRAIAERLGYRPNPLVQAYTAQIRRSKGQRKSCNLAWLPSVTRDRDACPPWLEPYQEGARQRAEKLGFAMDVSLNAHAYDDAKLQRILENRGVRGVLIPHLAYYERTPFYSSAMAVVGIGENPDALPMHTVTPDYFKNMTTAIDALLARGYQRIGFCEHHHATVLSQGMYWGAFLFNQQRMRDRLPLLGNLSVVETDEEASREKFFRWLEKNNPEVILTTFNQARRWLHDAGVKVPAQIGLAHLSLAADVCDWSGIDPGAQQIGSVAVDMVVAHIMRNEYGVPSAAKIMRLPGAWVDAATTRKPRKKDTPLPTGHTHPHEWFEQWFWNK